MITQPPARNAFFSLSLRAPCATKKECTADVVSVSYVVGSTQRAIVERVPQQGGGGGEVNCEHCTWLRLAAKALRRRWRPWLPSSEIGPCWRSAPGAPSAPSPCRRPNSWGACETTQLRPARAARDVGVRACIWQDPSAAGPDTPPERTRPLLVILSPWAKLTRGRQPSACSLAESIKYR